MQPRADHGRQRRLERVHDSRIDNVRSLHHRGDMDESRSNAADVGGAWILYNIVQANVAGIELDSFCTARQTLVQYNLIQNNNNPGPGAGNGIETSFGLCNAKIDNNKFSGQLSS